MTSKGAKLNAEPVREAAFGAVGATYAQLPPDVSHDLKVIILNNSTDVDVYISLDGTTDQFRVAAKSAKTIDLRINDIFMTNDQQFYQKRVSAAPTEGAVWVEAIFV